MAVRTQAGAAQAPAGARPLLRSRGVSKRFGAVQALWDADFEVRAGEVVALVGDNGAGKSMLVKIVSGVTATDHGALEFEGLRVTLHSPADAARIGIATVYQDLALCDNLDVVANLFLGREARSGLALDEIEMERESLRLLDSLSVRTLKSVRVEVGGSRVASGRRLRSLARCSASPSSSCSTSRRPRLGWPRPSRSCSSSRA